MCFIFTYVEIVVIHVRSCPTKVLVAALELGRHFWTQVGGKLAWLYQVVLPRLWSSRKSSGNGGDFATRITDFYGEKKPARHV